MDTEYLVRINGDHDRIVTDLWEVAELRTAAEAAGQTVLVALLVWQDDDELDDRLADYL